MELTERDADLAAVVESHGMPPLWLREPGYSTLVQIILEQQVSLASAKATFEKLQARVAPVTPEGFLALEESELRGIGFSRQKARYCRDLAAAITRGEFDIDRLERAPDSEARAALMSRIGIGGWTADIYLLVALGRPDVWPCGDLALAKATQRIKRLSGVPQPDELEKLSRCWRPWRAVAARLLWHDYLSD